MKFGICALYCVRNTS